MDDMVSIPASSLMRVRGFIRQFADACKSCYRKNPANCSVCDTVNVAKTLMVELDTIANAKKERYFVTHPIVERFARVVSAIETAGRPVLSSEIHLDDITPQNKRWTLKEMCRKHIIKSMVDETGHYRFSVDKGLRYYSNNNKGD